MNKQSKSIMRSSSWWFQPLWKILVKMGIFPKFRGENKTYLKPPPSYTLGFPTLLGFWCSGFLKLPFFFFFFWNATTTFIFHDCILGGIKHQKIYGYVCGVFRISSRQGKIFNDFSKDHFGKKVDSSIMPKLFKVGPESIYKWSYYPYK